MVSLKLRKIFYYAAAGAENVLAEKKKRLSKIEELENQIALAKKITESIHKKGTADSATIIRAEGKIRKMEHLLKDYKYKLAAL